MKRKSSTFSLSRPNGNRVAIYVRVSTALQAEEGFSLDAQEKVCRQFAEHRRLFQIPLEDFAAHLCGKEHHSQLEEKH